MLSQLRPRQQVVDGEPGSSHQLRALEMRPQILSSWQALKDSTAAAGALGEKRQQIVSALQTLKQAELIDMNAASQRCPLCAYGHTPTLHQSRLREVESWVPMYQRRAATQKTFEARINALLAIVRQALSEHDGLLPAMPLDQDFERGLSESDVALREAVTELRRVRAEIAGGLSAGVSSARKLTTSRPSLTNEGAVKSVIAGCVQSLQEMEQLPAQARRYKQALARVGAEVAVSARTDPQYRLREKWLACFSQTSQIAKDLHWETSKRQAQRDLEEIREELIGYRRRFLEHRRAAFNIGIQELWSGLRSDEYSMFGEIHIPEPRGRGFPIEIELKAVLDDGTERKEVDALRVFSESQTNALGIAAFVTRSKLLGHQVLVLDDPVQSMDEDHFKTFARDVIPQILSQGFQLVILTHNDIFARDISNWHYDQPRYKTMFIRHSKRNGSIVEDGNRRVAERTRIADRLMEEGRPDDAWKHVRLAIERLYLITYAKYGPADFEPESWERQAAEYMWNAGAGTIIESKSNGSGRRLKEMLTMTGAAVHEGRTPGETDLRTSTQYLNSLLSTLRLGG